MGDDPYIVRQRERDAEYKGAYAAWIASLPPEERSKMRMKGLDVPYLPNHGGGTLTDAAESNLARCEAAEIVEEEEPTPAPRRSTPDNGEVIAGFLRRLVGELIGQQNARLAIECLALVTGLSYEGDSMTEIAKRHGVRRATVSNRCIELAASLNLPPSRAMRSLEARKSYSQARNIHLREHS